MIGAKGNFFVDAEWMPDASNFVTGGLLDAAGITTGK
jgi:hypothetical protein